MVRRSRRANGSLACALIAMSTLPACFEGSSAPQLGRVQRSLAGAEIDTEHTGVVLIADTTFFAGYCSGTVIAPNLVLTAQHCVAPAPSGDIDCATSRFARPHGAGDVWVSTDDSVDAYDLSLLAAIESGSSDFAPVAEVHVPEPRALVCGNDIALLVLREPLPDSVQPIAPRLDDSVQSPDAYVAVGFGEVGQGEGLGTRRSREGFSVACGTGECPDATSFSSFTEVLGGDAVCSGDSGGPALDLGGRVFGIAARSARGCGSTVYTAVEPWASWIRQVATRAWQRGGYDEPGWLAAPMMHDDLTEAPREPNRDLETDIRTSSGEPAGLQRPIDPEPESGHALANASSGGCSVAAAPTRGSAWLAFAAAAVLRRRAAPGLRAARARALRPPPTPRAAARPPRP